MLTCTRHHFNSGELSSFIGTTLLPGAVVGGAISGGIAAEHFAPDFMGDYPAISGGFYGAIAGAALGGLQAYLAGGGSSPVLAVTMGLTGAITGAAATLSL